MRRSLKNIYPDLFSTMLVPKAEELIATPYRHEGNKEKAKSSLKMACWKHANRYINIQEMIFP